MDIHVYKNYIEIKIMYIYNLKKGFCGIISYIYNMPPIVHGDWWNESNQIKMT
jgi:hypothetical protein